MVDRALQAVNAQNRKLKKALECIAQYANPETPKVINWARHMIELIGMIASETLLEPEIAGSA